MVDATFLELALSLDLGIIKGIQLGHELSTGVDTRGPQWSRHYGHKGSRSHHLVFAMVKEPYI